MATEQDFGVYADQGYVNASDGLLVQSSGGAGLNVFGDSFFARRSDGIFRATGDGYWDGNFEVFNGNIQIATTGTAGNFDGSAVNPGMILEGGGGGFTNQRNSGGANVYLSKSIGYSNSGLIAFMVNGAGVGLISTNGTGTTYATTSDATLKTDDGPVSREQMLAVLRLVQVHDFRWKANDSADVGVFAQELHAVFPAAVRPGGWHDPETDELHDATAAGRSYQPWLVDYAKLMPVVIAAVQDIDARQDALEERLRRLEAAA